MTSSVDGGPFVYSWCTISFNKLTRICSLESYAIYTIQTILPIGASQSKRMVTVDTIKLRFSAVIYNKRNTKGNPPQYDESKVLYGNVIAKFNKGAEGYLITENGEWVLVAMKTDKKMTGVSIPDEIKTYRYPLLIGWVEKNKIIVGN
jgi:hypothetical protein